MPIAFRIRFVLGRDSVIGSPDSELPLTDPLEQKEISLKASGGTSISDAAALVLHGRPFNSEQEALRAANRWRGTLQKAFAYLDVGADFGDRAPSLGHISSYGREMLSGGTGASILDDVHGISVYEYPPEPRFAGFGAVNAASGPGTDHVIDAVSKALEMGAVMTGSEQVAYDLYAGSFSESSPDAKFVMLMMAVETLIDPDPRDEEVQVHVDRLISLTKQSKLPENEINSLIGSLKHLRSDSISRSGQKLASKLGSGRYMDEAAGRFFSGCYKMRNRLVHGRYPRPSREEVAERVGPLKQFVADLLSLELYEDPC